VRNRIKKAIKKSDELTLNVSNLDEYNSELDAEIKKANQQKDIAAILPRVILSYLQVYICTQ
jgi:hypothetical protein